MYVEETVPVAPTIVAVAPKSDLAKAAERNDLDAVRSIVEAASVRGDEERTNVLNRSRIWTEVDAAYRSAPKERA